MRRSTSGPTSREPGARADRLPRRPRRGFTLIELLLAVSILAGIGALLFRLLTQTLDLWEKGESGREEAERAAFALGTLERDLHAAVGLLSTGLPPRGLFVLDSAEYDRDGDGVADGRASRLRFTRVPHPEERGRPGATGAGLVLETIALEASPAVPGAPLRILRTLEPWRSDGAAALGGPVDGAAEEGAETEFPLPDENPASEGTTDSAAGGRSETVIGDEGVLAFWFEAERPIARIGAPDDEDADGPRETAARSPAGPTSHARSAESALGTTPGSIPIPSGAKGESAFVRVFDSTRGLLDGREGRPLAPEHVSPASLGDPSDDVYPRRVRLTLVLRRKTSTRLAVAAGLSDGHVELADPPVASAALPRFGFARIGEEWVRAAPEPGGMKLLERGASGSEVRPLEAGVRVEFGSARVLIVERPGARLPPAVEALP